MKLILSSLLLAVALCGQQNTVFRRNVFQGITTAQASSAVPNIGQSVHIFTLIYPSAVADVTGFTFRVEASYDNTTYFPISEDLIEAKYNGTFAYAIARCNGVFPYVRFRLVAANASNALTAHYTGSLQPIGIVRFQSDRYLAESPLASVQVSGPHLVIQSTYYIQNRRVTPIVAADWTSVNFDALTVRHDDASSITILDPQASNLATGWRMVCRSLPAPPYTLRGHFYSEIAVAEAAANQPLGFLLRNSTTGAFVVWSVGYLGGYHFWHSKYNSPTAFSANYTEQNWKVPAGGQLSSIQITDDGATRSWLVWNGTRTFSPLPLNSALWGTAVASTDFITPNQVCFGLQRDNGNYSNGMTIAGYDVNPTW